MPKQWFSLNRNSIPYLSGDGFADSSDFQVYPPKQRKVGNFQNSIRTADVVFCPSHLAENFIAEFGSRITAKVLIFGNSDREFSQFDFKIPKSVKHIFAQNLLTKNSKVATSIPIGLENLRLATNGYPHLLRSSIKEANSKILVGPFGLTHFERNEFDFDQLSNREQITLCTDRLSPNQYAKLASNHSYIAAPRGNGIDTHRLWESLYRGAIPIVRQSQWLENFKFLKQLTIEVDSWGADEIVESVRNSSTAFFEPLNIPELWWPYWESKIKAYL